jgi:hypothetical protein
MVKKTFAAITIMLLSATSGMAQTAAMKACGSDVKSLCAGVQAGDGRVKACIKSHFSDVSTPCQALQGRRNSDDNRQKLTDLKDSRSGFQDGFQFGLL